MPLALSGSACASPGWSSRPPAAARRLRPWRSASRPRPSQASRAIVAVGRC